jgi:hypothetical protein
MELSDITGVGILILRVLFTLWNAKPIPLGRLFVASISSPEAP